VQIYFGKRTFEAQGLFFDKDGTLVDLHHQYSTRMDKRTEKILARYPQEDGFRRDLARAVGYDMDSRKIGPGGPLAVATRDQTFKIVVDFLSQQGLPLKRAETGEGRTDPAHGGGVCSPTILERQRSFHRLPHER